MKIDANAQWQSLAGPAKTAVRGNSAADADFTHMTREGLFDWMNEKIRSGELSLEESTAFLGMTVKIPVNAGQNVPVPLDDREQVNFMRKAQEGLDWAQQNGAGTMLENLARALDIMAKYSGDARK